MNENALNSNLLQGPKLFLNCKSKYPGKRKSIMAGANHRTELFFSLALTLGLLPWFRCIERGTTAPESKKCILLLQQAQPEKGYWIFRSFKSFCQESPKEILNTEQFQK